MANSSVNQNVTLSSRGQLVGTSGFPVSPPLLTVNTGLPKIYNQVQPVLFFQAADTLTGANPNATTAANATATVPAAAPGLTCTITRFGNQVTVTVPTVAVTTAATNTLVQAVIAAAGAGVTSVCYTLPSDLRPASQQIVPIMGTTAGNVAGRVAVITTTGLISFQTAVPTAAIGATYPAAAQSFPGAASSELSFTYIAGA